jgi:hypothetical protein
MSKLFGTVLILLGLCRAANATINVTAASDRTEVHVGDKLQVTVTAMRSANDPAPSHAGLQVGPEWEAGAQTAESERADSVGLVKNWHFELTARAETTSTIAPVVILAAANIDGQPLATNRVLGPPITVTIKPERIRPWWIPHPRTLAILAGIATAGFTIVRGLRRRRQNRPRPMRTPLQDAMAMMEEVHANCREDRAGRFFADVERVLTGYLSRRMARPLGSATASEISAMASRYVSDKQTIADLQSILQRCSTVRFSGARADIGRLAETEDLTLSVLERLDAEWVTDSPGDETSKGTDRT